MESRYRGIGIRKIQDGDGNQDLGVQGLLYLGIRGPGSGCQGFPGIGIWGSGRLGGQILDTYIKFEGVGIEIWVSRSRDWDPLTGLWVSGSAWEGPDL